MTLKVGSFNPVALELYALADALTNKKSVEAVEHCDKALDLLSKIYDRIQLKHGQNQSYQLVRHDIAHIQSHLKENEKVAIGLTLSHLESFAKKCIGNYTLPPNPKSEKRKEVEHSTKEPESKRQFTKPEIKEVATVEGKKETK